MKLPLLLYISIVSGSRIETLKTRAAEGGLSCKVVASIGPPSLQALQPHLNLSHYWPLWASDEGCHYYLGKLAHYFAKRPCIAEILNLAISSPEPEFHMDILAVTKV